MKLFLPEAVVGSVCNALPMGASDQRRSCQVWTHRRALRYVFACHHRSVEAAGRSREPQRSQDDDPLFVVASALQWLKCPSSKVRSSALARPVQRVTWPIARIRCGSSAAGSSVARGGFGVLPASALMWR